MSRDPNEVEVIGKRELSDEEHAWLTEARNTIEETLLNLSRLSLIANAVGVLSTATLISAALARSQDFTFPLASLAILLVFALGVLCSLFATAFSNRARNSRRTTSVLRTPPVIRSHREPSELQAWAETHDWGKIGAYSSLVCLGAGTLLGFIALYNLAS